MTSHSYVYHAECEGYVKIGYSKHPAERIKGLQSPDTSTICPREVEGKTVRLVKVVRGTRGDEKAVHKGLHVHRVCGEWYHPTCLEDPAYRAVFATRECVIGTNDLDGGKVRLTTRLMSPTADSMRLLSIVYKLSLEDIIETIISWGVQNTPASEFEKRKAR